MKTSEFILLSNISIIWIHRTNRLEKKNERNTDRHMPQPHFPTSKELFIDIDRLGSEHHVDAIDWNNDITNNRRMNSPISSSMKTNHIVFSILN